MKFIPKALIVGHRAKVSGEQEHDPRQGRDHLRGIPQAAAPLDHGVPRHGRQEYNNSFSHCRLQIHSISITHTLVLICLVFPVMKLNYLG